MLILIAEDEPIIRLGLKSMLESMGHDVLAAVNGREAIQMVRNHSPDIAILDIQMPYTDGLEAAKVITREQSMPILILTAFSQRDLVDKATDLPIQGYLVKPVQAEELAPAIAVALKRHAQTEALVQRAAELEQNLESRKLIDRAKGILMQSGLSEEAAYRAIQEAARRNQHSMEAVARAILRQDEDRPANGR